jgi:hypothetical protein
MLVKMDSNSQTPPMVQVFVGPDGRLCVATIPFQQADTGQSIPNVAAAQVVPFPRQAPTPAGLPNNNNNNNNNQIAPNLANLLPALLPALSNPALLANPSFLQYLANLQQPNAQSSTGIPGLPPLVQQQQQTPSVDGSSYNSNTQSAGPSPTLRAIGMNSNTASVAGQQTPLQTHASAAVSLQSHTSAAVSQNLSEPAPQIVLEETRPHPPPAVSPAVAPEDEEDYDTPGEGLTPRRPPVCLYMSCDDQCISRYQCVVRQQIELFQALQSDRDANAQGRNRAITLGQVGIRCRHCSMLPNKQRKAGAVYFPSKVSFIALVISATYLDSYLTFLIGYIMYS